MMTPQRPYTFAKYFALFGLACLIGGIVADFRQGPHALPRLGVDEMRAQARSTGKPVFIDVSAKWCQPCRQMETSVFSADSVRKHLESRFIVNRIDFDDKDLNDYATIILGVESLPTFIIQRPDGVEWKRQTGSLEPNRFMAWLNDSTDAYVLRWLPLREALAASAQKRLPCMALWIKETKDLEGAYALLRNMDIQIFLDSATVPTVVAADKDSIIEHLGKIAGAIRQVPRSILMIQPGCGQLRQIVLDSIFWVHPANLLDTMRAAVGKNGPRMNADSTD